jgi:UDP-3-O-[3-hydroxymyristoyl] glucosamine N-acyltransferase
MIDSLIHPTAIVSPQAQIRTNVRIGAFSIIHPNVIIEEGTTIEPYCEIGHPTTLADGSPLIIGGQSLIRSHSILYEGSMFGPKLVTGHHVTVRERTVAGKNLQIGTKSDIQGHCSFGDFVRLHSNVHIGQKSTIGNFVWLFPDVLLTNDANPPSNDLHGAIVGDFSVLCAKVTILPGVNIGKHSVVGSQSLVGIDVQDGMFANGSPAKILCKASILRMKENPAQKAYPWPYRFSRGYPLEIVENWTMSLSENPN